MAQVTTYTATSNFTLNNVPSPPAAGNDLATAAAALIPGSGATSYANFAIPTWGTGSGNWVGPHLEWVTRWEWDATNLLGWLVSKMHADPRGDNYRITRYNAATNTLAMVYDADPPNANFASGHAYDSQALAPDGTLYFLPDYSSVVQRFTGSAWESASSAYRSGGTDSSAPRGLTIHPHLYGTGIPGFTNVLDSGRIKSYKISDGTGGTWATTLQTVYSAVRYTQGVYCSALNAAILSCGTAGLAAYRVDAGTTPTASRLPFDLPVFCASVASSGDAYANRLVQTPSGSVAILESASPGRVWRLNVEGDLSWVLQSYSHPLRLTDLHWPVNYVSTYGVYWALRQTNGGNSTPNSLLWRPPASL